MGFSPGNFHTFNGDEYHWEAKDNEVVLWDRFEAKAILVLSHDAAVTALQQLRTALFAIGIEE